MIDVGFTYFEFKDLKGRSVIIRSDTIAAVHQLKSGGREYVRIDSTVPGCYYDVDMTYNEVTSRIAIRPENN